MESAKITHMRYVAKIEGWPNLKTILSSLLTFIGLWFLAIKASEIILAQFEIYSKKSRVAKFEDDSVVVTIFYRAMVFFYSCIEIAYHFPVSFLKVKGWGTRHTFCLMTFLLYFGNQTSRTNISVAIVAMVSPNVQGNETWQLGTECPFPSDFAQKVNNFLWNIHQIDRRSAPFCGARLLSRSPFAAPAFCHSSLLSFPPLSRTPFPTVAFCHAHVWSYPPFATPSIC